MFANDRSDDESPGERRKFTKFMVSRTRMPGSPV